MAIRDFLRRARTRSQERARSISDSVRRVVRRLSSPRRPQPDSETSSSSSGTYIEYNPNRNTSLVLKTTMFQRPQEGQHIDREIEIQGPHIMAVLREVSPNDDFTDPHSVRLKIEFHRFWTQRPYMSTAEQLRGSIEAAGPYGSSEFLVARLDELNGTLRNVVLGESKLIVIRGGSVVYTSPQQMISYKHPFSSMEVLTNWFRLQHDEFDANEGDVIVMGTAGFWDNVEVERIEAAVNRSVRACTILSEDWNSRRNANTRMNVMFRRLTAELNRLVVEGMQDETWNSPFAQESTRNGFEVRGGRPDAYTVVLGIVLDARTRQIPDVWSLESVDINIPA